MTFQIVLSPASGRTGRCCGMVCVAGDGPRSQTERKTMMSISEMDRLVADISNDPTLQSMFGGACSLEQAVSAA